MTLETDGTNVMQKKEMGCYGGLDKFRPVPRLGFASSEYK